MNQKVYRALVLDDDAMWRSALRESLEESGFEVQTAARAVEAHERLASSFYDLLVVDINLTGAPGNQEGLHFLIELYRTEAADPAVVIVLSAFATLQVAIESLSERRAATLVTKHDFDNDSFVAQARDLLQAYYDGTQLRRALLSARIKTAEHRMRNQSQVMISVQENRFVTSELAGPERLGIFLLPDSARFTSGGFSRRADNLNLLLLKRRPGAWRTSAKALGGSLYQSLMKQSDIAQVLIRGRDLSTRDMPSVLQFIGPSQALRLPFELLSDGSDYVCFDHVVTRRLAARGVAPTRKGQPFFEFIRGLARDGQTLRVLLVGANSDGRIPIVEEEVSLLRVGIASALDAVGIRHDILVLSGAAATYENVKDVISGGELHMLHYAGHGRFDDRLPEISGLVFAAKNNRRRILGAAELKQLVSGTNLRFVFLSCCVGARTADQLGRGDFHGTLDALVRGDVPFVLGYRWVVPDREACTFACTFYTELIDTLSPGLAVMRSRRAASVHESSGRHNSLWASPILVGQPPG